MTISNREKFRAGIGPKTVVSVTRRGWCGRREDGENDGVPGTKFIYSYHEMKPSTHGWTFEEVCWGVPHPQFVDEFTVDVSGSLYHELLTAGQRLKRTGF